MADDLSVGVIGAGVMGSGIAQTLAVAGIRTVCTDIDAQALERGRQNVVSGRYGLERAVARGKQSRADADAATRAALVHALARRGGRVRPRARVRARAPRPEAPGVPRPRRARRAADDPRLQHLGLPDHRARRGHEPPRPRDRLALGVAAADHAARRDRRGAEDLPRRRSQRVRELAARCGKNPIVVKDFPTAWGFVANRIYFAMVREAQRVVERGDRLARGREPADGRHASTGRSGRSR